MKNIVLIQRPGLDVLVRQMDSGHHDVRIITSPIPETITFLTALPDFEGKALLISLIQEGKFQVQVNARSY